MELSHQVDLQLFYLVYGWLGRSQSESARGSREDSPVPAGYKTFTIEPTAKCILTELPQPILHKSILFHISYHGLNRKHPKILQN